MISLLLNGVPHQSSAATISLFVHALDLPPETLLVEHNGIALHRSEWPHTTLREGDRVELLRVSAGG